VSKTFHFDAAPGEYYCIRAEKCGDGNILVSISQADRAGNPVLPRAYLAGSNVMIYQPPKGRPA
jgi:hypothetical protein